MEIALYHRPPRGLSLQFLKYTLASPGINVIGLNEGSWALGTREMKEGPLMPSDKFNCY